LVRRHFFLIGAGCVLALMLVAGGVRLAMSASAPDRAAGAPGGARGVVAVSQATVARRPFVDRLDVLGVVKGRQSVTVTSNTTELITGVHFRDGAFVRKGQVLVDLKAQQQSAEIAQAQAALDLAELDYRRWKALGDRGVAAQAAVDQRKAALDQARAAVAAAESRRGDRVIRAPFSGVVGLSDVAPGTLINPGAPIVALDDIAVVRVDFDVPDRYISTLRPGLPILARTDAWPEQPVQGRVATVDTRVDQRTRSVKARAEFPNPQGRLRPGMLVHVALERGARDALAVPEAAVQFEGDRAYVFVLGRREGRLVADQRQVRTGQVDSGFVEVSDGLAGGEAIVADGVNRISPGQAVSLASEGQGRGPAARRDG
jgi:membrane fusion protein (multidrug efflux system)